MPSAISDCELLAIHRPVVAELVRDRPSLRAAVGRLCERGAIRIEIERDRRKRLKRDELGKRAIWRDRRLMALAQHKRRAAKDIGD